jgi:hypothetical protein
MSECRAQRFVTLAAALAVATPLLGASTSGADAQTAIQRRAERPLVPRSQARRQTDRAAERVYIPGHWAWDRRRGQYSWVTGRWERYDRGQAFVGAGWHFRNGQWTFGPMR